jgi:hypothetical protein
VGVIVSRGDELVEILIGPSSGTVDSESVANELLKEFFGGYPLERLGLLLRSDEPVAVKTGAWIASELGERAAPLMNDISPLLDHPTRYVRFFAIDAVLAAANGDDGAFIARAVLLINDQDGALRWKALQLLARAADVQLAAAVPYLLDGQMRVLVEWLRTAYSADISLRLEDPDLATRLVAVAAAARTADSDRSPLDRAAAGPDEEVASFAKEQLELLGLRRRG